MREPINGEVGQTRTAEYSDQNTDPLPRKILEDFLTLVNDVRTKLKPGRRKLKVIRSMGRHRLAAVREARETRTKKGSRRGEREVASPSNLGNKIRIGLRLYRLLTDTSGRDLEGFGTPVVSSHLTPIPCKRLQLIGAAARLEMEVAQGMALALEVPIDKSGTYARRASEPGARLSSRIAYQTDGAGREQGPHVNLHQLRRGRSRR